MENDTKKMLIKPLIYGSNLAIGAFSKFGNPIGAGFFGILDIAGHYSNKIKSSKYARLLKTAGAVGYSLSSLANLYSASHGNLESLAQLPFNLSMSYQLGIDSWSDYKDKEILDDFSDIGKALKARFKTKKQTSRT